jgi:hypothetical protein
MSGHRICSGQSVTKACFLRLLQFSFQYLFHRLFRTYPSIGGGTRGFVVAGVPSGLSSTTPRIKKAAIKMAQSLVPIMSHGSHYSNANRVATSAVFRSEDPGTFIWVCEKNILHFWNITLYYSFLPPYVSLKGVWSDCCHLTREEWKRQSRRKSCGKRVK